MSTHCYCVGIRTKSKDEMMWVEILYCLNIVSVVVVVVVVVVVKIEFRVTI